MTLRRANIQKFLNENPDGDEPDLKSFVSPAEAKALHQSHPLPREDKAGRQIGRLERLIRFYKEKAPNAPEQQSVMFGGFVVALIYAVNVIKMYRKLTKQLAEIAKEADDEPSLTSAE